MAGMSKQIGRRGCNSKNIATCINMRAPLDTMIKIEAQTDSEFDSMLKYPYLRHVLYLASKGSPKIIHDIG